MEDEDLSGEFGKDVVINTRDKVITATEAFLKGKVIGVTEEKLFAEFQKLNLSEEELKIIKVLAVDLVDLTINTIFWDFEQSLEKYKIITKDKNGNDVDIVTESDGLCYEQWGFIEEFSKYNTIEDILETGKLEKEDPAK